VVIVGLGMRKKQNIWGNLVVGGDDIKYDFKGLCDFVSGFLDREGFKFSRKSGDWSVGGGDEFSVEPFAKNDVWPSVYVLKEMQDFTKWAEGLKFGDSCSGNKKMGRVLFFKEGVSTCYSFGNIWTFGGKFDDCVSESGLVDLIPGAYVHDLIFDDGNVASSRKSFDGYTGFCERFGRDR